MPGGCGIVHTEIIIAHLCKFYIAALLALEVYNCAPNPRHRKPNPLIA